MNTDSTLKYQELSDKIIAVFFKVYNTLGYGFLEKIYENAMMIEFRKESIKAVAQVPIKVKYDNEIIGEYFADVLVDNKIIIEVKATSALIKEHEAQLLNYLKATDIEVGLLVNFGPKLEFKRKIYDNEKKTSQKESV